ncbi:MAG: glycoside hydrolase family 28 protein, partial [Ignavibacteriaceae bacterium]
NTDAFKITIEACSKAGGGQVVVPPGLWLTGPIELQSNIDFHVERGALILFSPNHNDYPIIKRPTGGYVVAPPIYGFNLENIAITGSGLIDGNGTTWRPLKRSKVNVSLWRKFVNSGGVTNSDNSIWYPSKAARDGREEFDKLRKSKKEITTEDLLPFRDAMRPRLYH